MLELAAQREARVLRRHTGERMIALEIKQARDHLVEERQVARVHDWLLTPRHDLETRRELVATRDVLGDVVRGALSQLQRVLAQHADVLAVERCVDGRVECSAGAVFGHDSQLRHGRQCSGHHRSALCVVDHQHGVLAGRARDLDGIGIRRDR